MAAVTSNPEEMFSLLLCVLHGTLGCIYPTHILRPVKDWDQPNLTFFIMNFQAFLQILKRWWSIGTVMIGSSYFDVAVGTFLAPPIKPQPTHPHFRGGTSIDINQFGGKPLGYG